MKRFIRSAGGLLALTAGALCGWAQAEAKPTICVLDFKTSGISRSEMEVFVDYLSSYIVESDQFRVIDRSQRETILKELEFSAADCTDEGCQLEIGKLLAASQIIVGSVGTVGGRHLLTIKMIDVESGQTLRSSSESYGSLEEMIDDTERLAVGFSGGATARKTRRGSRSGDAAGSGDAGDLLRHTVLIGLTVYPDSMMASGFYYYMLSGLWGVTGAVGYGLSADDPYRDLYVGAGGAYNVLKFLSIALRGGYIQVCDDDEVLNRGFGANLSLLFRISRLALSLEGIFSPNVEPHGFVGAHIGISF